MNDKSKQPSKLRSRAKAAPVALLLLALCCLIGTGFVWRQRQTAQTQTAQRQIAQRQTVPQLTYTQLPMPQGRDVRRAFVGMDEMNDIFVKRIVQENKECWRLGVSRAERHNRIFAVQGAGQAEINRVVASHYAKTFDPSVMDKAVQDVSK